MGRTTDLLQNCARCEQGDRRFSVFKLIHLKIIQIPLANVFLIRDVRRAWQKREIWFVRKSSCIRGRSERAFCCSIHSVIGT